MTCLRGEVLPAPLVGFELVPLMQSIQLILRHIADVLRSDFLWYNTCPRLPLPASWLRGVLRSVGGIVSLISVGAVFILHFTLARLSLLSFLVRYGDSGPACVACCGSTGYIPLFGLRELEDAARKLGKNLPVMLPGIGRPVRCLCHPSTIIFRLCNNNAPHD